MFPLSAVVFPYAPLSLHVFELRYRQLTVDCLAGARELGVVLITRGSEVGGGDVRSTVGTVARIERALPLPDGRWFLLAAGVRRIRVVEWLPDDPYPKAVVDDVDDAAGFADGDALERALAAVRTARGLAWEAGGGAALPSDLAGPDLPHRPEDAVELAWRLCHEAPLGPLDRQRLLEAPDHEGRLALLTRLVTEVADDLRRLLGNA